MEWTDFYSKDLETVFYFEDLETNNEFLVQVHNTPTAKEEAIKIANENFDKPLLIYQLSIEEAEAEALGLDTY